MLDGDRTTLSGAPGRGAGERPWCGLAVGEAVQLSRRSTCDRVRAAHSGRHAHVHGLTGHDEPVGGHRVELDVGGEEQRL